jgi:serine phosphatase RsbU (regulator of sigma subunit)
MAHAAVAVRYVPAAEAAQVGGDWYDAFLQRDGDPVLVIGDVVGHDTAAAATMGQLRGLLRGVAHHSGAGPSEVLRGLDQAIAAMHPGTMATAAVVHIEGLRPGEEARLRWANAGHPPPVVLFPDGVTRVLGGPLGDLMLGVDETAERAEHLLALPPGAVVLLYTDGLIERRGSSIDAGMDRLCRHLADLAERPVEDIADEVLARMLPDTPPDDVALVVVRLAPGCRPSSTG